MERRQITVLFSDLVGSSALANKLDPEDWHALLQRLHARSGAIIEQYHGHVAQYLGDGLLAYFGYPFADQDSPRHAVAAAIQLAREVRELRAECGETLNVRVGIHTGPAVVGNVGSREHQEALALGETPNLASRIQEIAPAGSVVVSRDTYRLVRAYFACEELGEFQLKGFAQPVPLVRVLEHGSPRTKLEAASVTGLTPLIGREEERAQLLRVWRDVQAGGAASLVLIGEAGIGKSRLLHLVTQEQRRAGGACVELRCSEPTRSSAFHPVSECLQRLAAIQHGESAETTQAKLRALLAPQGMSERDIALIATLFGVALEETTLTPAQQRSALLAALAAWLSGASRRGPQLIAIEDLHWADPSTLELVAALLERAAGDGSLLVLSARPEFSAPWLTSAKLKIMTLTRLALEQTRELIASVARHKPLPEKVRDRVAQRAEGIPLFLEEMTKAVLESGLVQETEDAYVLGALPLEQGIPASLLDSLTGRLDQLGHGKPMAQLAAVLGREFSLPLFTAVWRSLRFLPDVDPATGLERLVQAQLLTRQGEPPSATYEFRHALLQDAASESLLRSVRREYHRHTATVLLSLFPKRAEFEPELVAYHFRLARRPDEASLYFSKAGQRAIASSAHAEAIAHFTASLEELAALPPDAARSRREIDLRSRLGLALITLRGFAAPEVEETYSRAAELCDELGDELPVKVLYGIWVVNLVRSDALSTRRMVPNLERIANGEPAASTSLVVNAMLGAWAFFRADYAKASRHCLAAAAQLDDRDPKRQNEAVLHEHGFEGALYPLLYLAWTRAMTGENEGAWQAWQRASELARRMEDPYASVGVLAFAGALHHDIGERKTAGELAQKMRELAEEKGFVLWLSIAITICGNAKLADGDVDEAITTTQQGLDLMRAVGAKNIYPYYSTYLAEALLARAEHAKASELLTEALGMTRRNVDRFCEPEILRLLGEAELASGALVAAREYFSGALEVARSHGARLYEQRAQDSLSRLAASSGGKDAARASQEDLRP